MNLWRTNHIQTIAKTSRSVKHKVVRSKILIVGNEWLVMPLPFPSLFQDLQIQIMEETAPLIEYWFKAYTQPSWEHWPRLTRYLLQLECLGPPKSYVKILNPRMMIPGGEALGRWLHHEGSALMIRAFLKEVKGASLPVSTMWKHTNLMPSIKQRALNTHQTCWHVDLGIPSFQNCEQQISVGQKLLGLKYFSIAAEID